MLRGNEPARMHLVATTGSHREVRRHRGPTRLSPRVRSRGNRKTSSPSGARRSSEGTYEPWAHRASARFGPWGRRVRGTRHERGAPGTRVVARPRGDRRERTAATNHAGETRSGLERDSSRSPTLEGDGPTGARQGSRSARLLETRVRTTSSASREHGGDPGGSSGWSRRSLLTSSAVRRRRGGERAGARVIGTRNASGLRDESRRLAFDDEDGSDA